MPSNLWQLKTKQFAQALSLIAEALILLSEKRETLEEKLIKTYFARLSICCSSCLEKTIRLSQGRSAPGLTPPGEELEPLLEELLTALQESLKVVRYDFNFLEQYYEHAFFQKLENEYLFLERLGQVSSQLDKFLTGSAELT